MSNRNIACAVACSLTQQESATAVGVLVLSHDHLAQLSGGDGRQVFSDNHG